MYRFTREKKREPERRWALPDRVFLACGACHIPAYAFMERHPEAKSRTYDGLWLREPRQFLHDALPRARRFLGCFPPPPGSC